MIDVKELRVGNWVYAQSSKLVKDISQPFKIRIVTKQEEHKWEPIPITEDVLLKCGFVNGRIKLCHNRFLQWNYGYDFCIENGIEDYLYEIENVKNLHQLQNLIFSLTNQDLIYTP